MTANILRGPLPYGLSAGEGSASSSDGSSLSSSMNRSRTSTGDSSLSTDTNGSSESGIPPPTPPSGHQTLSSSSIVTNATRRRSHRPRGCRGGRKNRKKNSQTSGITDSSSCSTNQQAPGVPTEIVGTSIPLSPRDSNTQTQNSINMFSNSTHLPSKAILNPRQPHEAPVQKMSGFGAEVNNRNTQQSVPDENTRQATMTENTTMTTTVAEESFLLPHSQPIFASANNNTMGTTNGQQDHQHQIYPRHPYPHPTASMRFQHHPSHTFIAHPMSYDRSISENRVYLHNDGDLHPNADNNNNFIHQEQQQPQQSTMDPPRFDPSRSVDAIATKTVKQIQMLATASNNDKMSMMGDILPPLPSTKREESPVLTGPNPYALTLALTTNADRSSANTASIIMTASTTTASMTAAQSSNGLSQLSVQTMNLHHMASVHSETISNNNNHNNNGLSSSTTQDCYRTERLEKQRQMLADGGSLFVISPRSFLTGVKVGPTTAPAATTTTAW